MNEGVASRADKAAFPALRRVKATRALSKAQTAFVLLFHNGDVWELCARSALKVGWLLFKCSTVNKGFNGVKTKSGINSTHFKVTWSTRGTVTKVSYRKWRVRASSLSTETAPTVNKETPDVVQAVLPWSSLNQQYAVKFLSSSATLNATKSGWHMRLTRRSEVAKQPKTTNDGVWRSRFFYSQEELSTPNNKLRIQVRMFVTKSSSALSKLMPLKYKQAFPVLFMSEGSYVTVLTWSSYHCLLAMVSVCLSVQCRIHGLKEGISNQDRRKTA